MRSTFRSLIIGPAMGLCLAALGQQPYTWIVSGSVSNCYPGQTVQMTVSDLSNQNTLISSTVTVDANTCTYLAVFELYTQYVGVTATTMCNGALVSGWDSTAFFLQPDTSFDVLDLNCGGGTYDCMQVLNGPDMPGTPCDDGNPATLNDLWSNQCVCAGQDTNNVIYDCLQIPFGPNMPGTFCTNFLGDTGVWSANCVCLVDTNNVIYDCLQIPFGPNMPGTPCVWNNQPGTWGADCACNVDTNNTWYDCLNIPNGPNLPGLACDDNDPMTTYSYWTLDCMCVADSANYYDCLQIPNGPNLPGTPCAAFGVVGTWTANCTCEPNNPLPCQADFWVLQAFGNDSLPVPYELWIWNLSSGGLSPYTFLWSFGDGTSSNEAFPSHTYNGNGPYNLCLTLSTADGCTSTHCDSVSVDQNGIFTGVMGGNGDRTDGFTINVQDPNATAIPETPTTSNMTLWPNPATDVLNIALNGSMTGATDVTVTDLNGRVVMNERHNLNAGRGQFSMNTAQLVDGIYMVRIGGTSQRFVKTH